MNRCIEKIYQKQNLTRDEMTQLAESIFSGVFPDSQLGALLIALKMKGEVSEELTGIAEVMQQKAQQIAHPPFGVMDNCGTGGDFSNSFNISTTAAFVLAGGGIPMAKHGNRSVSSRSGSADVLEALGADLTLNTEAISYLLQEAGIAFLFAPAVHPAMNYVMKVRQELATPTIFNLVGPLTNPVPLTFQLMGTYSGDKLEETAKTLGQLGRKRALVVHGANGMDEANLAGSTQCVLTNGKELEQLTFTPSEIGLPSYELSAIVGGDAQKNSEILCSVLRNEASPYLDTVLLNAGLGFFVGGQAESIAAGIAAARQSISSGAAYDCLRKFLRLQKEVA